MGAAAGDDEKEREDELAAIQAAIEAVEAQTRVVAAAAAASEAQLRNVRRLLHGQYVSGSAHGNCVCKCVRE
jgi:hypothetical protein